MISGFPQNLLRKQQNVAVVVPNRNRTCGFVLEYSLHPSLLFFLELSTKFLLVAKEAFERSRYGMTC